MATQKTKKKKESEKKEISISTGKWGERNVAEGGGQKKRVNIEVEKRVESWKTFSYRNRGEENGFSLQERKKKEQALLRIKKGY